MSIRPLKHIVFIPAPSWGHLRPAIKTSLRMVEKFHNLFISLFVYDSEVSKATKYLDTQLSTQLGRVRIVTASGNEATPILSPANPVEIFVYLEKSFKLWIARELQQTTTSEVEGRVVSKPSWIIEDQFNGGVSLACKDFHKLPIVSWWLTTAGSLITQQGNQENGHGARVFVILAEQQGISFAEAGEMYLKEISDRLVCIPGLPAHHEWELNTQYLSFVPPFVAHMAGRWTTFIKQVDLVICCTTFEMEPITASALSNALDKPITPFFIGPSVDIASPQNLDPESQVAQFLNRAYTEKGAHSVIYVAFGTGFFPPPSSVSHLTTILDEIVKAGFRFIFALSSPSAKLDQSWMDAHVRTGSAIFPEWTNQIAVLDHPLDQPANALQIATIHNCGFELLQVRTGPAKSTAYQNGREVEIVGTDDAVREEIKWILELSRGPRGAHQRQNARLLGRVISDSLSPGGSGDRNLQKLGEVLGLSMNTH